MTDSVPKTRLPRTWTIVLLGVVLLVGGGALMVWLPYHRNQTAIAEVERLGGYTESVIVRPAWIPNVVDDEDLWLFERVIVVDLTASQVSYVGLEHLRGLTNLEELWMDRTQVTDVGLEYVRRLNNLRTLSLIDTQVSDAGLEHISQLISLRTLTLDNTQISDAGLEHLLQLTNLKVLWLDGTQVTDAGTEKLRKALPDCLFNWTLPSE
ncbi:Leucine Rich repeats (2 copies) [Symmachiella macrocystis]|uniref:Leucine Rich repeats (2 copies) n=1 Tax=Symmachiella macrocystis TaxID=2527985 RepID=A0A5C6BBR6_9PLAN|nr:leucine-rich repeat domain-containing protein [Symmachiella macrocystis]TWU09513.1 Leucine Rich repeats (2 copies) [Symmachiella macrocystis]